MPTAITGGVEGKDLENYAGESSRSSTAASGLQTKTRAADPSFRFHSLQLSFVLTRLLALSVRVSSFLPMDRAHLPLLRLTIRTVAVPIRARFVTARSLRTSGCAS